MNLIASFDDAVKEDLMLSELMQEFQIPTIFYFPSRPKKVNEPHGRTSLTHTERRQIADTHEIGSHTQTHPLLTRIDPEWARREIYMSKLDLEYEFGQPINGFCYPRGYANPTIENMVREAGYTHARGVTVGYLFTPENPYYEQTTVHVGCDRKEYAGHKWYEYAMLMLEQSLDNSTFHIWGHGWEINTYPDGWYLLRKFLEMTVKRGKHVWH